MSTLRKRWAAAALIGTCLGGSLGWNSAVAPVFAQNAPKAAAGASEPATAEAAKRVIDLLELPRLKVDSVLDETSSLLFYEAKGTLAAADAFYQATLAAEGWKPAEGKPMATADYVQRQFLKQGFVLRLSVGSARPGFVSINLAVLGNVDVRTLPRMGKAAPTEASTFSNATFETDASLDEAAKFCREQMKQRGWREYDDPQGAAAADTPHLRFVFFRKADVRIHAIVYRDPQKLDKGPTSVSWLAMPVLAEPKSAPSNQPKETDLAESRPTKKSGSTTKPKAEAEPPEEEPAPTKPMPTTEESDVTDLAAKIQADVRKKLEKELKGLKELGDLNLDLDLGSDDMPKRKKTPKNSPKSKPTVPNIPRGDDDDDSPPTKQAPKAAPVTYFEAGPCKGYLQLGDKKVELKHAVAAQYMEDDERTTLLVCSDLPLKLDKFKRAKPRDLSCYELTKSESKGSLCLRLREGSKSLNASIGGASISVSSSKIKDDLQDKQGRLTAKATLAEPEEFFDKEMQFEVSVDLARDTAAAPETPATAPGELELDEEYDLPLPADRSSTERIKSPYRSTVTASFTGTVEQTVKFFRRHLPAKEYRENAKQAKIGKNEAQLSFVGKTGPLQIGIKTQDDQATVELIERNETRAKEHGIAPAAGMSKLLIGNSTEEAASVTVGGKTYKLKAGEGTDDPSKATKIDLKPGRHAIGVKVGTKSRTVDIEVPADGTWGLLLGEGDDFSELFY